jgi:transcriptional regulator with XRE-family HTH domain
MPRQDVGVTNRDGPIGRALRVANEDEARVRADLARARRGAGLSRAAVAGSSGLSRSTLERLEMGTRRSTIQELAAVGAAVGLDVRLRAYPAGDPIRDAGQQRLLGRLHSRCHPLLGWATEVVIRIDGDRRAWDAVISGEGWSIGIEAETVLDDLQAVERRLSLKRRDGGTDHQILLVADTRRNRRALAAGFSAFARLSGDSRTVLAALAAGHNPALSAVVVL